MFNAGAATVRIEIQNPLDTTDTMGAPMRSWVKYLEGYASVENSQYNVAANVSASGPREETVKAQTFVIRNHISFDINARQRVLNLDTGETFKVVNIRYDSKVTQCFIDVEGGVSNG